MVIQYYHDPAYTMPSKNYVVFVCTPQGKQKQQKKLLVMTVDEMFENFKADIPDISVG